MVIVDTCVVIELRRGNSDNGTANYTTEDYNAELNEAENEYQKGNVIAHEELKRQMKNW